MGKWRGKIPRFFSPPVLQSLLVPPTDQTQPQAGAQESRVMKTPTSVHGAQNWEGKGEQ